MTNAAEHTVKNTAEHTVVRTGERAAERTAENEPNALVEQHLYLVQHVLNQLATRYPRHVDRGELWSAGAAGLVEASRRFDPSSGVPFPRFASIRIRGAMIDSTRTRDWATRGVRRGLREVSDASRRFEEQHGRTPAARELARSLGISEAELAERHAAAATATLLHLDQPISQADAGEVTLGECLAEGSDEHLPEAALERMELAGTVRTGVAYLPPAQREVVERTYFGGELLRDVAESMGVTEARVSQIRAEALHALRAYFSTAFEAVPAVPANAPGSRQRAAYVAAVSAQTNWRTRLQAGRTAPGQTTDVVVA